MSEYSKIPYDYKRIGMQKLFEHTDYVNYPTVGVQTPESIDVYGQLRFPELPADKAYTIACFVTSLDGKLSYPDNPAGPVIAQSNFLDPDGATADFWTLNLFRASCDAIFVGAGTMQKEPNTTVHIFDQFLEDERIRQGYSRAPWAIVSSLDGTDIPYQDTLFIRQPVMVNTSPKGWEVVSRGLQQEHYLVGPYVSQEEIKRDADKIVSDFAQNKGKKIPVLVTGKDGLTDSELVLRILKLLDIHKVMVESPSYCHSLMQQGLLNELVCNYSCVYIGGSAISFGSGMAACTSTDHPHTEMISIHSHSPSFFYFRHRLVYGVKADGYMGAIY